MGSGYDTFRDFRQHVLQDKNLFESGKLDHDAFLAQLSREIQEDIRSHTGPFSMGRSSRQQADQNILQGILPNMTIHYGQDGRYYAIENAPTTVPGQNDAQSRPTHPQDPRLTDLGNGRLAHIGSDGSGKYHIAENDSPWNAARRILEHRLGPGHTATAAQINAFEDDLMRANGCRNRKELERLFLPTSYQAGRPTYRDLNIPSMTR